MDRYTWIRREVGFLNKLLPDLERNWLEEAESVWMADSGANRFYVPPVSRPQLLAGAKNMGFKLTEGSVKSADYDSGKVELIKPVLFEIDLTTIMVPTDADSRPFMLDREEQEEWCKNQGGTGLPFAEENLYLILRMKHDFGRMLFAGGWMRCLDSTDPELNPLRIRFTPSDGLSVRLDVPNRKDWHWGCFPRRVIPLG